MSEKVVLTENQAKMIENHKGSFQVMMSKWHTKNCHTFIDSLSAEEIISAFFDGYEIEKPKFQPGDYVFVNWASGRDIHRVLKVNDNGEVVLDQEYPRNCHPRMELVQPTTTEEAYWLGELGRKCVGDFKDGDIYIKQDNGCYLVGSDVFAERASNWYEDDDNFKGIYPADAFKPFFKEESK